MEVDLIAPSGYPPDRLVAARACERLERLGFRVRNPQVLTRRYLRFAGTDEERLADLHAIAAGEAATIAMAVRGGYGMTRLLECIDFGRIARQAGMDVPIVGHSDFTAFNLAYLAKTGQVSFAGPMLLADFGPATVDPYMQEHFLGILSCPQYSVEIAAPQQRAAGSAEGMLWGGNLAMLCSLLGTPWWPEVEGGILFLEDINEPPYRVERLLLQLAQAGVLKRQKAILLGDFSGYRLTDYENGYDMDSVVGYLAEKLSIPVLTGLPFGHCARKLTLPVGGQARLDYDANGFRICLSAYPYLKPSA